MTVPGSVYECVGGPLDGKFARVTPTRTGIVATMFGLDLLAAAFPWPHGWYYLRDGAYRWRPEPETFIAGDEKLAAQVEVYEEAPPHDREDLYR